MPDNIIFASFEVILKECNEANKPIFTSEAGLVSRGAVAAFGADFYGWGYQAGEQAVRYLDDPVAGLPMPEVVRLRRKVANEESVIRFGFEPATDFEPIKPEL
jgi:putative tryptophan/tyrosine transport system substrate-binding protein